MFSALLLRFCSNGAITRLVTGLKNVDVISEDSLLVTIYHHLLKIKSFQFFHDEHNFLFYPILFPMSAP